MTGSHAYPRPQLERDEWTSLNGDWEFAIDREARWTLPAQVSWDSHIEVPFSPETPASGIGDTGLLQRVLVSPRRSTRRARRGRRGCSCTSAPSTTAPPSGSTAGSPRARRRLHAVLHRHHRSPGEPAVRRRSSCAPRTIPPICQAARQAGLAARAALDLVSAHDRHLADRLARAWCRRPGSARVRWTPNLERWEIGFEAWRATASAAKDLRLDVKLRRRRHAAGRRHLPGRRRRGASPHRALRSRHRRLPQRAALESRDADADRRRASALGRTRRAARRRSAATPRCARSACRATGSCSTAGRILLRMVLDQGYWPDTGLTAPDDDALRRDVELAKAMGFNGVRKHQKIEDPRYLYWADRSACWSGRRCRAPTASRSTRSSALTREWTEVIERDCSHPVHRRLGAVQRVVGRAGPARQPRAAALRAGAVSPDQDARSDAAGDRQRRLGERRHRHHRHPRLRRPARAHRRALRHRRSAAAPVQARAPGRPAAGARRARARRPARSCSPSSAASPSRQTPTRTWGYSRCADSRGIREAVCARCWRRSARCPCWRASATRSSPTRIRRPTGCSIRAARPSFRSRRSRWPRAGRARQKDRQMEWMWREHLMNSQRHQYMVPSEDYQTQENR